MNPAINPTEALFTTLPEAWHEPVRQLAAATLQTDTPLRLILLGAFSVGKSSLLNSLIGESLLPSAPEETTALPTFIEYGAVRSLQLLGQDGSLSALDEAAFTAAATVAPEGAACALINLPLAWLQGISIIDLPGLGSVSAGHRAYTLSQIAQADVVLYLLPPRGPSQDDLELLTAVQQAGKRVKVMVTQWDQVEAAVAQGEKAPSLEQWAARIETATRLKCRLVPCSRAGLGREEILDFVQRAKDDTATIRQRRFLAELKPLLQNALGQNAARQQACQLETEAETRQWHEALMQRKQALIEFKAGLYARQQEDRDRILQQCTEQVTAERQGLEAGLNAEASGIDTDADWPPFMTRSEVLLKTALSAVASALSQQSGNYGQLDLPEAQVAELNLHLPSPATVDMGDFLDMGRISRLQQALSQQQETFSQLEQKLAGLTVADMSDEEQALYELMQQRQTLAGQPLPRIVQQVEGGKGAAIGRFFGEIADIGLFFIDPVTAGTKTAALLGKGVKVANTVAQGVKVLQVIKSQNGEMLPQPIREKLGYLEALSFGYWGERVGTAVGGGPVRREIIDPEAWAAQQSGLARIDQQTHQLRQALARNEDIANERQLSGWALEQSQKEQARLEGELQQLQLEAEQTRREVEQSQQAARQAEIKRQAEKAVTRWLHSFDQQTTGMLELLRAAVKNYWEERVEGLLSERLAEQDSLRQQSQASHEEKQALLKRLQDEANALNETLGEVDRG